MTTATTTAPTSRYTATKPRALGLPGVNPSAIATWLLGYGLVVYLSMEGGGYDSVVRNQLGIAIWWVAMAGIIVGAFPLSRMGRLSWVALGLLTAFTAWMALGLIWTESAERTAADLGRVTTFVGVFALALLTRGRRSTRRMVTAVGAGIATIALISLASRLQPDWLPGADDVATFFGSSVRRLDYPLGYWNGLAVLVALGLPLILHTATSAKSVLGRSLAAAAIPAMCLTIFFTLSRGGSISAAVAIAVYLLLSHDRLPRLLTAAVGGLGAAILIAAAIQRPELADGLIETAAARQQGDEMLTLTLVVCAGVGLLQAAISYAMLNDLRPAWSRVPHRLARNLTITGAIVAFLLALAVNVPGHVSDLWDEFSASGGPGASGAARLESFSGTGRYQLWEIASTQASSSRLKGTGSGTYELWHNREGQVSGFVRDAHSLYIETLAELGLVGFTLLITFLLLLLGAGGYRLFKSASSQRSQIAAAFAACVAFCLSAAADWTWEIAVIPIAFLLLASVMISAGTRTRPRLALPSIGRLAFKLGAAVACLAAIVAIALPLSTTALVRTSQQQVQANDLSAALEASLRASAANPSAATPRVQQALVFEQLNDLPAAAEAARAAIVREPDNWRYWLMLSRFEAKQGNASASLRAYRRARELNPNSALIR